MQKVNSIQCIQRMRISPLEESRFHIPLCRMVYRPLVRPTLANDIKRLEAEFTHGYQPGAPVFYVSIYNDKGEEWSVKDVDTSNWGLHWTSINEELKPSWLQTLTCASCVAACFLSAMETTASRHGQGTLTGSIVITESGITLCTPSVYTICLDTKCKRGLLLNAMHDINK
jgi:hypothetical protein